MAKLSGDKLLSKREEYLVVEAGRRVLLGGGFPNPERVGCPGSEVLKAIALRKISMIDGAEYIDHVGCCSPCFTEYDALRRQAKNQKRLRLVGLAAGIAAAIGIGVWAWLGGWSRHGFRRGSEIARQTAAPYQQSVLDLRNRSVLRGTEPNPNVPPIELPKAALALSIYLPTGSEPGKYEVEFVEQPDRQLVRSEGSAALRDHIAVVEVRLNLELLHPGHYLLGIRQAGWDWTYYPAVLK
jgi:hypothetical protein